MLTRKNRSVFSVLTTLIQSVATDGNVQIRMKVSFLIRIIQVLLPHVNKENKEKLLTAKQALWEVYSNLGEQIRIERIRNETSEKETNNQIGGNEQISGQQ